MRGKIIFCSIILAAVLGYLGFRLWDHREAELGGYQYAGIQPIPGATMVSVEYINQTIRGGTTVWVYKLPTGYAQELYKDCSRIGYKKGTYRDDGASDTYLDAYVKPGVSGCYTTRISPDDDVIAQFVGDSLLVSDIF